MPNLKDIRKRISSIKNTQKITRAMKLVSAAKLRRAQEAVVALRPYAEQLEAVTNNLIERADRDHHPLMWDPEHSHDESRKDAKPRALLLIVTADRGLCGAYNANVNREAHRFIKDHQDDFESLEIGVIGRKGVEFLRARKIAIETHYTDAHNDPPLMVAERIMTPIIKRFEGRNIDEVHLISTRFMSAIAQVVHHEKVLPLERFADLEETAEQRAMREATAPVFADYLYEPSEEELLNTLLPRQIVTVMQRALLESIASEYGARMSAMDNATNNAGDLISNLTLQYNRARQAAITKELIEIISGADAV